MDSDLEGILPASLFTHRITLKLTLITVITGSFFYSFYPLEWVLYEMLATPQYKVEHKIGTNVQPRMYVVNKSFFITR